MEYDTEMQPPPAEEGAAASRDDDNEAFTTRPYQEQMIELALKRNTIIFLPTGAGKTYIALQTIKRMSKVLEKPLADGGKRSVFLTNTVALAKQQAYWIGRLTPLRTVCYTGDLDVDNWSGVRWREEFDTNQVLVATCQIVLDVIRHGYVSLHELNIIVMDECHNATGKHQMSQLMSMYHDGCATGVLPVAKRPRIIGLSGALLGNNVRPDAVVAELDRMERQFDAHITTVSSTDEFVNVLVYSTKPAEKYVPYQSALYKDTAIKRQIIAQVEHFLCTVVDKWPLGTKVVATKTQFRAGHVKLTKIVRKLFSDFQYQMNDLGMYGAGLSILAAVVELEMAKRRADAQIKRQLCRVSITFAERIRKQLVDLWQEPEPIGKASSPAANPENAMAVSDDKKVSSKDGSEDIGHVAIAATPVDSVETILSESSPKVLALIHFLTEHCRAMGQATEAAAGLKCLVFVQRRHSAKLLYHILKNYAAAVEAAAADNPKSTRCFPIRPDFMVGNNSALCESLEAVLENKFNAGVLDRFKHSVSNLIVATNVLEEGIDLQMCNLVISYDAPTTYRSYIQSKGRARMRNSTYAIMAEQSEQFKLHASVEEFKRIEETLRAYLIGRAIDRPQTTFTTAASVVRQTHGPEAPLRTAAGAVLHAVAALALVNRYNMTMPTDEFCRRPIVRWQLLNEDPPRVRMRLPMQSPLKTAFDSAPGVARDLLEAKRSVALQACRALHEMGELDDHLMPFAWRRIQRVVAEELCSHWQLGRFAGDADRMRRLRTSAGRHAVTDDCTGLVRQHAIGCAAPFYGGMPQAGCTVNLYCIAMETLPSAVATVPDPNAAERTEFRRHFGGDKTQSFGILTAHELPNCGAFRLHSLAGPVEITLAERPVRVQLASSGMGAGNAENEELAQLRRFHEFVFGDVLKITLPFLVADYENKEHAYLIVPTTTLSIGGGGGVSINWPLVQRFQEPMKASDDNNQGPDGDFGARKRAKMQYRAEDYQDRVVFPWYRMDSDRRYIVVRVHEHLTPNSPFPNDAFASYAAYIEDKYQLQIVNADQFMLEVLCVSDASGLNALVQPEQQKPFAGRHVELLIPELCQNLAFPGGLWLKAMLLPSILHRLHTQFHAEWLRAELNAQITIPISADYKPWPIVEQPNLKSDLQRRSKSFVPARAIVIPNPEEAPIREIRRDEFVSVSSTVDRPWQAPVEPLDIGRHLLDAFPFELDYLYKFVNSGMEDLHLFDDGKSTRTSHFVQNAYANAAASNSSTTPHIRGALCTSSAAAQRDIRMLGLDTASETRGFEQSGLVAALICPAAKDIVDYRRRAVLGRAVIAFSVTVQLLVQWPRRHVGWLRCAFDRVASAHNLAIRGIEHGLAGRLKSVVFAPRDEWTPPLQCVPRAVQKAMRQVDAAPHTLFRLQLSVEEKRTGCVAPGTMFAFVESFLRDDPAPLVANADEETAPADKADDSDYDMDGTGDNQTDAPMSAFVGVQRVADVDVANALRAVIGESAAQLGLRQTFNVLRFFQVLPESSATVDMMDAPLRPARNAALNGSAIDELLVNCTQLEKTLGYTFRDRGFLLQALTHPSFEANAYTDCNQTLAMLGACVCDLLLAAHGAEHADHLGADELRDLCAALGSNIARACFCVRHQIHLHLLFSEQALGEKISAFQAFQELEDYRLGDRVLLLIEETDARMGEYVDVPAAVGECFAAVVAAIYLDCGRDLERVWQCLWPLVRDDAEQLMWQVPKDLVTRLEEWPGAKPKFERALVDRDVLMVAVRFTHRDEVVLVHGFGQTAGDAKLAAAKVALHVLMQ